MLSGGIKTLAGVLGYLWQGFGALASLMLFLALWQWTSSFYDSFILPSPGQAWQALMVQLQEQQGWQVLALTAKRAASGFALALGIGAGLGMLAGLSVTLSALCRPLVTLLLGTPPVAWLVLALLWFGSEDGTPVFTVFVACLPVLFANALQGVRTLDGDLREMAEAYALSWCRRFWHLYLPHILSYLLPAVVTAIGVAWKVVVMAELLGSNSGVGAQMAQSRSLLETPTTLAWICAVVLLLLACEYLLLEPVKRKVEAWRYQS